MTCGAGYASRCEKDVTFIRSPEEAEYGAAASIRGLYDNLWDLAWFSGRQPV